MSFISIKSIARITEDFKKDDVPPFPCFRCGDRLAVRHEGGFQLDLSAESEFHWDNTGEPTTCLGIFTLRLTCSNFNCREPVNCVGSFKQIEDQNRIGETCYSALLSPKFFIPTIPLFSLPEKLPERVKKPLMDSFAVFWVNPNAAANSLRISLEALMDHRCIKKWVPGNPEPESLHKRIVEFQKNWPALGDKLLAIKWLGNSGSHLSGLERKDLIEGYMLYAHILEELFDKQTQKLDKMAKRINNNKGPV